ncbi:MAG: tRNA pseudouridine(55) synthase TruB [SAR324 cluster bacterium]|nr:tRNA pseudouridine(55) synthase TruB [SAR324 cluster bacterium]
MLIINIDKPVGWTSTDVVRFSKKQLNEKKAGHLGTLDPMASGVLPVFLGKSTKLIHLFENIGKTYEATFRLGIRTDTFDATGITVEEKDPSHITLEQLKTVIKKYEGINAQLTPIYSAVKFQGVPAYRLARAGKEVHRKQRQIIIDELTLLDTGMFPEIRLRIQCSKGTYIRTLADDMGLDLGVGAHMTQLRRIACGSVFTMENISSIDALRDKQNLLRLDPLDLLSHLPTLSVNEDEIACLSHGQAISAHEIQSDLMTENQQVKVIDKNKRLVAIGCITISEGIKFNPFKVFI